MVERNTDDADPDPFSSEEVIARQDTNPPKVEGAVEDADTSPPLTAGALIFAIDETSGGACVGEDPPNQEDTPVRFDCRAYFSGNRAFPLETVIRFDRGSGLISGDVFARSSRTGHFVLGGREDWQYSFVGSFKQASDGCAQYTAICDVYAHSQSAEGARDNMAAVSFGFDGDKLDNFDFEMIVTSGGGSGAGENWTLLADQGIASSDDIRRIHLHYAIAKSARGQSALIHELLAQDGPVFKTLAQSGIAATFEEVDLKFDPGDFNLDPIYDPSDMVASTGGIATPEGRDWSHFFVFIGQPDADQSEHHVEFRNGQAFGLSLPEHRFRSRFGAFINLANYLKVKDPGPKARLRTLIVHELGHLLNIPHAWRRHLGHPFLGAPRPDALSAMNYAKTYPLGPLYEAKLPDVAPGEPIPPSQQTKAQIEERRRRRFYKALGDKGYDAQEQKFLWHAPLDHIAQGGRTFLDDRLVAPKFEKPTKDVELRLERTDGQASLKTFDLVTWVISGDRELQPIPLRVSLPSQAIILPDFRFETGAVQLLIQEQKRDPVFGGFPPVIAFDPKMEPDAAWCETALAFGKDPKGVKRPGPKDQLCSPKLQLPWVRETFVRGTSQAFKMQIVYYQRPLIYRSQVFDVSFAREKPWTGARADFRQAQAQNVRKEFAVTPAKDHGLTV